MSIYLMRVTAELCQVCTGVNLALPAACKAGTTSPRPLPTPLVSTRLSKPMFYFPTKYYMKLAQSVKTAACIYSVPRCQRSDFCITLIQCIWDVLRVEIYVRNTSGFWNELLCQVSYGYCAAGRAVCHHSRNIQM